MIAEARDLGQVNRLLERDFPGVDFSEVLAEPLHTVLIEGENGAVFLWRGPGVCEVHVFFAVRGAEAIALMHKMLDHMRRRGGRLFWALVPASDRKVRMFARLMGWKSGGIITARHGANELFFSET